MSERHCSVQWRPIRGCPRSLRSPAGTRNGRRRRPFVAADMATDALEPHLQGADAIVHLPWLFQPTHRPTVTWRVNAWTAPDCSRPRPRPRSVFVPPSTPPPSAPTRLHPAAGGRVVASDCARCSRHQGRRSAASPRAHDRLGSAEPADPPTSTSRRGPPTATGDRRPLRGTVNRVPPRSAPRSGREPALPGGAARLVTGE